MLLYTYFFQSPRLSDWKKKIIYPPSEGRTVTLIVKSKSLFTAWGGSEEFCAGRGSLGVWLVKSKIERKGNVWNETKITLNVFISLRCLSNLLHFNEASNTDMQVSMLAQPTVPTRGNQTAKLFNNNTASLTFARVVTSETYSVHSKVVTRHGLKFENDVWISKCHRHTRKKSECSYQVLKLRPSDY